MNGVTLGDPTEFRLQEFISDDTRVTGNREKRGEQAQRMWYDLKVRVGEPGWVDATFTLPAQFALHAFPGSITLGPAGGVESAGLDEPAPATHRGKFRLPVTTEAFTLSYSLGVYVFAAADPTPVIDLRRVLALRRVLENDPQFLASLDGPPDQRPCLFVQVYPDTALAGGPLSQAAVVKMFGAADVLAAFIPAPVL